GDDPGPQRGQGLLPGGPGHPREGRQGLPRAERGAPDLEGHHVQLRVHGHAGRGRSAVGRLLGEEASMRITQGTFSFLPDFTDEEIEGQLRYAVSNGWALSIEYTDDAHPRNAYWEMWGLPHFATKVEDIEEIMREVRAAREAFPE